VRLLVCLFVYKRFKKQEKMPPKVITKQQSSSIKNKDLKKVKSESEAESTSDSTNSESSDGEKEHDEINNDSDDKETSPQKKPRMSISAIPPRPETTKVTEKKDYSFRITITNGQNFLKFMLPIANAVNEMRFNLSVSPTFSGLRLEAHDTCATLANISKFDCDIDSGDGVSQEELNQITFCVSTKTFMHTMNCSVLKEAVLKITKYTNGDSLTFESSSNEDDVRAAYSCDLLDNSSQEPLQFSINLNFHVTVELKTLKELIQNAKKCGASAIRFEVFQRVQEDDENIVHSRMNIGFKSGSTSGSHGFLHSAKKSLRNGVTEWTSVPGSKSQFVMNGMQKKCDNSYDVTKLRTFLSHMDCTWALIHLPDDNTEQPLVIECDLGGPNTKHTIIISPNLAED
jgi:hypothetical protein